MADIKDAMSHLEEMADLLEILEANPFKVRAFRGAARHLQGQSVGPDTPLAALLQIPGVGKSIAPLVHESLSTGEVRELAHLRAEVPQGVRQMLALRGVGPSKVRTFWRELGAQNVGELAYACRENRLLNLKGFGEKAQAAVLRAIDQFEQGRGRLLGYRALAQAAPVVDFLQQHPHVAQVQLCGGLRRQCPTAKDADVVVATPHAEKLAAHLLAQPFVANVQAHDDTRLTFVLEEGLRVDVRLVTPEQFAAAAQYFTGSKAHNTALRERAKKHGLKLNEYGLFKNEKPLPLKNEEDLYHHLGLHFVPPPLREDMGELADYALGKSPPPLVAQADIRGVFHLHTTYSDGANTLEEMVQAAVAAGFDYLGISDHSQSSVVAGGLSPQRLLQQNREVRALQKKYPQIALFHGVEADIHADGALDYDDDVLAALDFVIGSVHGQFGLGREAQTARLVRALAHPHLTMLGHPTGRLLLSRDGVDVDMEAVLAACATHGKVMEHNANPLRLDLDWTLMHRCRELKIPVSINPDAHRASSYHHTFVGVGQAQKGGLAPAQVFNTLRAKEMAEVLEKAKKTGRVWS